MSRVLEDPMNYRKRQPFYRGSYSREALESRRLQIGKSMNHGEIAVFTGAAASGAFDLFRQYNDFYYLTGTEVPHSYLVIAGGGGGSSLFLEALDERTERSEGPMLSLADGDLIRTLTGIENIHARVELEEVCQAAARVFIPNEFQESRQACQDTLRHSLHSQREDPFDQSITRQQMVINQLVDDPNKLGSVEAVLRGMRLIKDSEEINWMVEAGAVTAAAINLAMQATKPGIYEYQLGAIADGMFLSAGASGSGYRPIIAQGENIWNAHYFRNNSRLSDGELVIMDYAPDLHYYTSDIGRMWPVNGIYSEVQRELYGFIVEYHKILLDVIAPGLTPEEVHENAKPEGLALVKSWRWSKDIYQQAALRVLDFEGHCSHTVGMAVHDNGQYFGEPMKPGLVFALDPQMWVPEEEIYIRVEDTIVITEDGYINVTADAAFELDEVEALMKTEPRFSSLGI